MKKLLLASIAFAALIAGPATAADLARPIYRRPFRTGRRPRSGQLVTNDMVRPVRFAPRRAMLAANPSATGTPTGNLLPGFHK